MRRVLLGSGSWGFHVELQGVGMRYHLHFFPALLPFRMSLEDFCRNFHELSVCRNVNNPIFGRKELESVVGCWTVDDDPLMNRSGGCYNNRDTFLQNPQVGIRFILFASKLSRQ